MISRFSPPSPYDFLPLSVSSLDASLDWPLSRASMNAVTTRLASSSAVGWGGRAGATATQSELPRTKANAEALGAQTGD